MKLEVVVIAKRNEAVPYRVFVESFRSKNLGVTYQVTKGRRDFNVVKKRWITVTDLVKNFTGDGYQAIKREAQLCNSVKIDLYAPWVYSTLGLNEFSDIQGMLAQTASKSFIEDPDQWQAQLYNFAKGQDMDACMSDLLGESLTFFAPAPTDTTELIADSLALSSVDQSHMTMPGFGAWA